jgi:hypothetical protein
MRSSSCEVELYRHIDMLSTSCEQTHRHAISHHLVSWTDTSSCDHHLAKLSCTDTSTCYPHLVMRSSSCEVELDRHIDMLSTSCEQTHRHAISHHLVSWTDTSSCDHHLAKLSWTDTSSCDHHEMSTNTPAYHDWHARSLTRLARTLLNTTGAMVFLQTSRHAIIHHLASWTDTSSCYHHLVTRSFAMLSS